MRLCAEVFKQNFYMNETFQCALDDAIYFYYLMGVSNDHLEKLYKLSTKYGNLYLDMLDVACLKFETPIYYPNDDCEPNDLLGKIEKVIDNFPA